MMYYGKQQVFSEEPRALQTPESWHVAAGLEFYQSLKVIQGAVKRVRHPIASLTIGGDRVPCSGNLCFYSKLSAMLRDGDLGNMAETCRALIATPIYSETSI